MFYRALVGAIVVFWLWMTFLLVRMTWFPQLAAQIAVPTAYIWKLVFLHEEPSDLVVYNQRQRLGNLHLQPNRRVIVNAGSSHTERQLKIVGGFLLDLPVIGRQNVIVHGSLDLSEHDEISLLRFSAVFNEPKPTPPGTTLVLDGAPENDRWHYSVQKGEALIEERSGTVAQLLDRPELRAVGFDPTVFARVQGEQFSRVSITARHGKLRLNHEDIDTYVVSIKDGNGLESTIQVDQLGQIRAVNTFTGISLLDSLLTP